MQARQIAFGWVAGTSQTCKQRSRGPRKRSGVVGFTVGSEQGLFAERSGLSQQHIFDLERKQRNPTVVPLYELAQALKTTPADLVCAA